MYNELINEIRNSSYNENMLFSLYNELDDNSSLLQLSNQTKEKYCIDDFEWVKLDIKENGSNIDKVYKELKNIVENTMDGNKKGVFILKRDKNICCVKLKNFDKLTF